MFLNHFIHVSCIIFRIITFWKCTNHILKKKIFCVAHILNFLLISKLNSEIADLKSEKAYLQDKCHSLEKQIEQPSTPKVIFHLIIFIKFNVY